MLKKKGIEVDLIDINEEDPPLTTFDGVIIGTGIKITMWVKKIKKYIKNNKKILGKRDFTFGFFVSCGTASEKEKIPEAKELYIDKKFRKIGLTYDIADAFGPIYDFSENSALSKINKNILKSGLKDDGWEEIEDIVYDLRDKDQIQKFAEEFTVFFS